MSIHNGRKVNVETGKQGFQETENTEPSLGLDSLNQDLGSDSTDWGTVTNVAAKIAAAEIEDAAREASGYYNVTDPITGTVYDSREDDAAADAREVSREIKDYGYIL